MGLIEKAMSGKYESNAIIPPVTGSSEINVGTKERVLSVTAGAILTALGLKNFSRDGLALAITGGALILRGSSGYCPINEMVGRNSAISSPKALTIRKSISINRNRADVYQFWRQLENLPKFMSHLLQVDQIDKIRSKWIAAIPGDLGNVHWEAEILREDENRLIKWQSLPGSALDNSGEVRFQDAGGKRTILHVTISYRAPLGDIGNIAGKIFNPLFENMVKKDLEAFKHVIEALIPESEDESFLESAQSRLASKPLKF
jgi:uncharacterized membrane protein